MTLTWEEKLEALADLAQSHTFGLQMRKPGDWYLFTALTVVKDGFLTAPAPSSPTPTTAVEAAWNACAGQGQLLQRYDGTRWSWTGYRWRQVPKPDKYSL